MTEQEINLTRGVPPMEVLPVEEMIIASEAAFNNDGLNLLQYTHAPGYVPLLNLLAERYGVCVDRVFTGNSSLEVLEFIIRILLKPGVRVFVESPSYDRANKLLLRSGADVVGIPLESDGMDLDAFEAELKKGAPTLLYVIPDFQNPMGTTTSEAKRRQIAKWAEEYDFYIAEDAPYRMLRYKGDDIQTFLSIVPERVFHMCSLSKLLAPGLRLGYAIAPAEQVKRLTAWAADTYIGPVGPSQGMVYEYYRMGLFDKNVEKLKKVYAPRLEALEVAARKYIPDAEFPKPEGGFFISLTLPEGNTMDLLLKRAPQVNLKITDGRGFFLNPADGNRFLRIPFCTLSTQEIDEAMRRISSILVK
ncbi:MAG: PLP-dependent aminotransferase family protein [Anaerolineaceae bacterium]|nr:PLP-dependent aminotransferase family protein [Anaerolineaceae bacterium]